MLTISEVNEYVEHWSEEPPIGLVIRSYLGVKPQESLEAPPPQEITPEKWEEMKASLRANAERFGRAHR